MKNGGLGWIEYENRDTTPMNKQKERFLYFHKFFVAKGGNIAVMLATLDYLTLHEEEYNNLSLISPGFTSAVLNNFWAQAVIELYAFYYKKNGMSFAKFFNYVRGNWNLIFTGEFYEHIHHGVEIETRKVRFTKKIIFDTIGECEKIIDDNKEKLEKLRFFRNKLFAHYSDFSKEKEEHTISINDLQDVLSITEQILNKIEVFYDRVNTSLHPTNECDISHTCNAIKKYLEYRREIQEINLQKIKLKIGENR